MMYLRWLERHHLEMVVDSVGLTKKVQFLSNVATRQIVNASVFALHCYIRQFSELGVMQC